MFIIVIIVFVFVLFGVVLQVYGTNCVSLKLHFQKQIHMNCFRFLISSCGFSNSPKENNNNLLMSICK